MIDDELEQPQAGAEGYQLPDVAAGATSDGGEETLDSGEGPVGAAVEAMRGTTEQEKEDAKLMDILRAAHPDWLDRPQPGAEGLQSAPGDIATRWSGEQGVFNETDYQAPFPENVNTETTTALTPTAANLNEYSFELELDSIDSEAFTIDIHVGYGEINDTPPDGMTGADDFILTIPGAADGTEVYAIITYDTDTLDITSRTLAFDFSVPDPTFGVIYWPIGFIDITYNTDGSIDKVNPHNRQCGDMKFEFGLIPFNGAPGIAPIVVGCSAVAVL